jgi:hypothetical protein
MHEQYGLLQMGWPYPVSRSGGSKAPFDYAWAGYLIGDPPGSWRRHYQTTLRLPGRHASAQLLLCNHLIVSNSSTRLQGEQGFVLASKLHDRV